MATFPERALASLNLVLTGVADAVLAPILWLPPLAGLLVVSLVTAVVMLLVVGRTSDQAAMRGTKRRMQAALFEIRLYGDDLVIVLRALGEVLAFNLRYLRLSLVPLAWMIVPLTLVLPQLHAYYGYAGLAPGQPALVKAEMAAGSSVALALEAPAAVRVDTPAVRLAGSSEVVWRIVPLETGVHTITIRGGDRMATKTLHIAEGPARRSPKRVSGGLADVLLYPSEDLLPADSPVSAITVTYPEPGVDAAGWPVHWMILYIGFAMAAAFVLAPRLGVTL